MNPQDIVDALHGFWNRANTDQTGEIAQKLQMDALFGPDPGGTQQAPQGLPGAYMQNQPSPFPPFWENAASRVALAANFLAPGAPRSGTGYSLSSNLARAADYHPDNIDDLARILDGGQPFHYAIFKEGEPIGSSHGIVKGDTAHVNWIGAGGAERLGDPGSLGPAGLKALREQMRSDFPDVKIFTGERVSGAREKAGVADDPVKGRQTLRLPEVLGGLYGADALVDALRSQGQEQQ